MIIFGYNVSYPRWLRHGLLAIRAGADKFQQVPVNLEPRSLRELYFDIFEITISEIDNFLAPGADQVMVVLNRPPYNIAMAITTRI